MRWCGLAVVSALQLACWAGAGGQQAHRPGQPFPWWEVCGRVGTRSDSTSLAPFCKKPLESLSSEKGPLTPSTKSRPGLQATAAQPWALRPVLQRKQTPGKQSSAASHLARQTPGLFSRVPKVKVTQHELGAAFPSWDLHTEIVLHWNMPPRYFCVLGNPVSRAEKQRFRISF